ncbi:MAG: hypothetical protein R3195_02750 [Gemmatimonadota bacterium]|nr:hypothetical protein [Gemmatimonadota bacterium]
MRRAAATALFVASFAVAAPAAHAQPACEDISGEWAVTVTLGPGTQEVALTIEQAECVISGLVVGDNETPFEDGTVDESSFSFTTTVSAEGQSIDIEWLGTVEGDAMSGSLTVGAQAAGEFSGTRGG